MRSLNTDTLPVTESAEDHSDKLLNLLSGNPKYDTG